MSIFDDPDRLREAEREVLGVESKEDYEVYTKRIEKLHDLIYDLEDDWDRAFTELAFVDDEQFYRRTLTRTLFAVIEGTLFALKQLIREEHKVDTVKLSCADLQKLRKPERHLGLKDNVKFTLFLYAHARKASVEFTQPLSKNPRWSKFCEAIEIRNRLMHPKSTEDLIVSDSEWEAVQTAEDWFFEQYEHLRAIDDQIFKDRLSQLAELLSQSEEEANGHTTPKESTAFS